MNTHRWLAALFVGMALLTTVWSPRADDSAVAAGNTPQAARPLMTLTGNDSQIKERSYHRIMSEDEWIKIWQQHRGVRVSKDYDFFYNPLGLPDINFEKCMVIAAFQGSGWNSAGLRAISVHEEKDRILLRFVSKGYQTGGPEGGGKQVTVYGFFLLPRSDKTVVVEEEQRFLDRRVPTLWQERATFHEAQNRDTSSSRFFPRELVLPDAPKTARDIEAFRSLRGAMTMADVVRKCGLPDDDVGSGIHIFIYRLRDGSTVNIGTANLKSLIYVRHVDKSGKATSLL
jgi:hypothetical protein